MDSSPSDRPPAGQRVSVSNSRVRCPYCHDDVATEQRDWVACAGCLARHHQACWEEVSSCSACGVERRLAPTEPQAGAGRLSPIEGSEERHVERRGLAGGATRLVLERSFLGEATIEDAAWLQATVRRTVKLKGRVSLEGRALVWRPVDENGCRPGSLVVSLTAERGRSKLRLESNLRGLAGGLFGGILPGVGAGGVGALFVALSGLGVPTGALTLVVTAYFTALFLLTRWLFGRISRQREEQLERLLERLTQGLSWGLSGRPPRSGEVTEKPAK